MNSAIPRLYFNKRFGAVANLVVKHLPLGVTRGHKGRELYCGNLRGETSKIGNLVVDASSRPQLHTRLHCLSIRDN